MIPKILQKRGGGYRLILGLDVRVSHNRRIAEEFISSRNPQAPLSMSVVTETGL
jgi:hypothetical protein